MRAAAYLRFFAILAAAALFAGVAHAQALRPKVDYINIEPQPTQSGERIEVVEFFWYGCPHCNMLQPHLESWLKRKPADVEFRRVPAIFRESWAAHARIFYTLEALGELGRLHQIVYRTIHGNNEHIDNPASITDWAVRNGIDGARWMAMYNSADIEKKVQQSRALTRAYDIPGTPSLVVDGRYLTSSGMAESYPGVVKNMEGLVQLARERRAGK